ncbi:MAG TPA: response regulator [Candidatus Binatia bacterium]|nr:response regulator [Candidatus Binatia bacterium]
MGRSAHKRSSGNRASARGRAGGAREIVGARRSHEPADGPAEANARARGHGPILVVEDNPEIREATSALLQADGHQVAEADNGAQALAMLRAGLEPCLIVLDLVMPVLDGYRFRDEQLRDERLATIPTIVCSATPDVYASAAAMRAAAAFQKGSADISRMLSVVNALC